MRSKLIQQIDSIVSVVSKVHTASSNTLVIKGLGWKHVDTNAALGRTDSAYCLVNSGLSSGATGSFTVKVQESDDDTDGNYTDVTLNAVLPVTSVTSSAGSTVGFFLKTAGLKQWVRLYITMATVGATDTCPMGSAIIRGDGNVESLPRSAVATVYRKA
jgi:hypothetical protein